MLELGEHPWLMATPCSDAVSHPVPLPAAARQAAPCTPPLCAPFPSLQGDVNTLSLKLKAPKRRHDPSPREAQERCLHLACTLPAGKVGSCRLCLPHFGFPLPEGRPD